MSSIHQHGTLRIGDITSFDLILLLIISETTQQALIGDGFLGTQCFLLVTTLAAVDQAVGWAARRWSLIAWLAEGVPLVILEEGRPLRGWMERSGVQESDILMAAREAQGLEQLEQIKYAVLERAGGISILPKHE
jgi:uncharacterized membrane protein YcaP (DUF421 family)